MNLKPGKLYKPIAPMALMYMQEYWDTDKVFEKEVFLYLGIQNFPDNIKMRFVHKFLYVDKIYCRDVHDFNEEWIKEIEY